MQRKSHTAEDVLFDRARDFRAAGLLPRSREIQSEDTEGAAADCTLCGQVIPANSPHLLLRWTDEVDGHARSAVLHPYCHGVWLVTARPRRQETN